MNQNGMLMHKHQSNWHLTKMEFKSYFEFGGLTSFLLFLDQQTIPGPNKKENKLQFTTD